MNAENTEQLKNTITSYGLIVKEAGSTVTVTGKNENVDKTLTLDIPTNITVEWQADITTNVSNESIIKKGEGELKIQGGSIINSSTNSLYNAIRVDEGNLTISGGKIFASKGYGVRNNSTGTVDIKGGTISMRGGGGGVSVGIYNASTGAVNISGGTISAHYVVHNVSSGKVDISGGTLSAADHAVLNSSTGAVNISGGVMTSSGGNNTIYGLSSGGTIDIRGGEISANEEANGTAVSSAGKIIIYPPARIASITSK